MLLHTQVEAGVGSCGFGIPRHQGNGRAGKSPTAGTTSSPVHKTNMSPSSLPKTPAVGLGDLWFLQLHPIDEWKV